MIRYVPFRLVEDYLRLGWEVILPRAAHPTMDAYRVMMLWRCQCLLREPGREK